MSFLGHESEVDLGGDFKATLSTSNTVSEVIFGFILFLYELFSLYFNTEPTCVINWYCFW
jgi:hypothetical protein